MANSQAAAQTVYAEGGYFIAPLTQYSVVGLAKPAEESEITDDGANFVALPNIFDTELKTMKLDLYYNSDDSRDMFNKIFGLWRTSYTSYLDFKLDYGNALIKSRKFDTARNACEEGFSDIQQNLYRGLLAGASTVYDEQKSLCVVRLNGEDVGKFNVWHETVGIVGDYHYLTKPSGETLVFSNNGDHYAADDNGVVVTLHSLETGEFEYIDANSFVRTYSNEGKLTRVSYEGQETNIIYDENYKIDRIEGPLNSLLDFDYDSAEKLTSIAFANKKIIFSYDGNNLLQFVDVQTDDIAYPQDSAINEDLTDAEVTEADLARADMVDDASLGEEGVVADDTANIYRMVNFAYNDRALLESLEVKAVENSLDPLHSIPSVHNKYFYDDLGRIERVEMLGNDSFELSLTPNIVTRTFASGEVIEHELSYIGSKQNVQVVNNETSTLDNDFNGLGQLERINLVEASDQQIVAQGTTKPFTASFGYNSRGLINKIEYATLAGDKKFVQLGYKSKYPKPTKVLTNDDVTFFDINQKGQLIRKTSVKLTKEMRIRAEAMTQDEARLFVDRTEKSYHYDDQGFLQTVVNEVSVQSTSYEVDANGKTTKKLKVKPQYFGGFWDYWHTWFSSVNNKGWSNKTGFIDVTDTNTQTVFVGGANDDDKKIVSSWADRALNVDGYKNYYEWSDLDTFLDLDYSFNGHNPFGKVRDKLVVIGYSWGGDSAVEASKQTSSNNQVDLLITVDPVGVGDHHDGAKYWIQLYAQSGRPTGGYLTLQKSYKTIKVPYWGCRRHKWHFHCGMREKTVKVYYFYPKWIKTMTWNQSDWIAYAGGKGTYGSYDPGKGHPDQFIKIPAHHGDFAYMLWSMENGQNHNTNNEFEIDRILRFADFPDTIQEFNDKERRYGELKADYGVTLWD